MSAAVFQAEARPAGRYLLPGILRHFLFHTAYTVAAVNCSEEGTKNKTLQQEDRDAGKSTGSEYELSLIHIYYLRRVSRPFLDRMDLCLEVRKPEFHEMTAWKKNESSGEIRKRRCV